MTKARSTYAQRRAALAAETRTRILTAAKELIPSAEQDLSIDAIARQAGVGVQSIYDHFGSKGGLLVAVVDDVQRDAGLREAFDAVFRSADGETALRRMIAATLSLWDRAWPFLGFILRTSRTDPVVAAENGRLDALRHAHLWAICRRLEDENRIRDQRDAEWAADQAFALTTATVYEEYVPRRGWPIDATTTSVTLAATSVVLAPGSEPMRTPPPDWGALEMAAAARAIERGADAALLPSVWPANRTPGSGSSRVVRARRNEPPE